MNRSIVKHAALFTVIVAAAFSFACGGGGGTITSNPAPTPTSGPYSASSLNGTYAFEMSGVDTSADSFLARVGSFTANGAGGVTAGVQDLNSALSGSSVTLALSSGTYTIGTSGKGTLTLVDSAETAQFSIVMTSASAGLITETDGIATASGNFTLQDTSTFAAFPTNFSGPYVFDFSGLDPNGAAESIVGQFTGNGAGGFTAGTADVIEEAGMSVERVYKVKEGRPNAVDLIKGDRIQLIVNTPHGVDPFFDEKAIRRAAVIARIPTITTISAARAAAEGIAALQRGEVRVQALQTLHAERVSSTRR